MALIDSWADFWSRFARNAIDRTGFPFTEAYVKAWCKVVQKYPNLVALPFYGRAFAKATCPLMGYPDPPGAGYPPYPEGKCFGVKYFVSISITQSFFNGVTTTTTSRVMPTLTVWGRIERIGIRQSPNISTNFLQAYVQAYAQNGQPFIASADIGGVGFTAEMQTYLITRADGISTSADCVPPYQYYPPDPPINQGDFNPRIEIPIYNSNNNITGYNIIPVKINLNPSLSLGVDFDIDGKKYYFDFSGWNVGNSGNSDGGGDRIPPGGGAGTNLPPSGNTGTEFDPTKLDETPVPTEELKKPGIKWAKVVVSKLPDGGKRLVSADPNNVDHFAGFFSWTIDSGGVCRMEEIPIRKRRYIFPAPLGATGVKYYAINGAILSVSVFTTKGV